MQLTILGCGSIGSNKNCSSYLVEAGENLILFDIGPGAYSQMINAKTIVENIMAIFITHTHVDHVNDLPAILWRYMYGTKRSNPLDIFGPKGFKRYFRQIVNLYPNIEKANFKIRIKEINNETVKIGKTKVTAKTTAHANYSNAYRIEHKGKVISYSGDTDYCKNIIELAKNSDILLLECSLPNDKKAEGHLTPKLCAKIAGSAKVKKLVLVHLYPECEKINLKKEIAKSKDLKCDVLIGKDKMKIRTSM